MPKRFTVVFKRNVRMLVNDIIDFEKDQIDEIKSIASEYEQHSLQKGKKYGIALSYITEDQKNDVLSEKRIVVGSKSSQELKNKNIVQIGDHSLKRILKRVGSTKDNVIISLINRVKTTDTVTKAQFKGFPTLSYTLIENGDPDEYIFAISFIVTRKGRRFLKMVTVHLKDDDEENEQPKREETEFRIGDLNPKYLEQLANMREFIQEQEKKH